MATHVNTKIGPDNGWLPNGGTVSQDFGVNEYIPSLGLNQRHLGIDIATASGSPVTLPGGQTAHVVKAFYDSKYGGGNTIELALADGTIVDLFHLKDITVHQGQVISGGDLLGHVDSTGNSTGSHLHFQIMRSGVAVDPWHWLTAIAGPVGGTKSDPCAGLTGFAAAWCQVTHVAPASPSGLEQLGNVLNAATDPKNWWKATFVSIGGVMILMGVIIYFFQEEKQIVVTAAPIAAAAA